MKRLTYLMAFMSVWIVACQKEKTNPSPETGTSISQHILQQRTVPPTNEEKAGYYHNYYLHKYYESLQAKINTKQGIENMSVNDFKTPFRTSCTNGITGDNAATIKNNSNNSFDDALADGAVETVISENIASISNASTISSGLKTFMTQFIEDGKAIGTIQEMETFTENAWTYASAHFSSTEKSIAQSTIWVYRYSFTYWSTHATEWRALVDPNGNASDPAQKLGKYGSADASGFTSGAITGAILGGSVTLGTMTAPGWLVGGCIGAVANSAGAIVGDLWDWLWG